MNIYISFEDTKGREVHRVQCPQTSTDVTHSIYYDTTKRDEKGKWIPRSLEEKLRLYREYLSKLGEDYSYYFDYLDSAIGMYGDDYQLCIDYL